MFNNSIAIHCQNLLLCCVLIISVEFKRRSVDAEDISEVL